jgi:DnaJ-domain-containing protein 1
MTELTAAVCSITPTQRRRFFWAAWWTGAPRHAPFRKPDASNGGATTREQALADAMRVAGRHLVLIEPHWAHAWNRMLRGEPPPPPPSARPVRERATAAPASAWEVLGLAPGADAIAIKRAFRQRALETHPDRGGQAAQFREVQRAYERLLARLQRKAR